MDHAAPGTTAIDRAAMPGVGIEDHHRSSRRLDHDLLGMGSRPIGQQIHHRTDDAMGTRNQPGRAILSREWIEQPEAVDHVERLIGAMSTPVRVKPLVTLTWQRLARVERRQLEAALEHMLHAPEHSWVVPDAIEDRPFVDQIGETGAAVFDLEWTQDVDHGLTSAQSIDRLGQALPPGWIDDAGQHHEALAIELVSLCGRWHLENQAGMDGGCCCGSGVHVRHHTDIFPLRPWMDHSLTWTFLHLPIAPPARDGNMPAMVDFLYAGELTTARPQYPEHLHDHWEVCLYVQGHGIATIGGTPHPFQVGDIIVFPPHIPHGEQAHGREGYRCQFFGMRHYAPPAAGVGLCHEDEAGAFRSALTALIRENHQRLARWQEACRDLTHLLCTWLQRWTGGGDAAMRQAADLLQARMAEPDLRIESIAEQLGLSMRELREGFRSSHGLTPRQFLTRLRLEQGRSLLLAGHPVTTVASLVGLPDPFYFSRLFHAHVGKPPSAIRRSR